MDWKPDDKKVEELRGTVIPSEWGVNDEVTVVAIVTEDGTEYLVSESRMVRRLMKHMDEVVEVDGFLGEDEYGEQVLVLGAFTALAGDDDDFMDDDDDDDEDMDDMEEDEEEEDDFESYTLRRRTSGARRPVRATW
ncbi:MAG: hypothetical protein HN904_07385 [Victivallales bacterium]|nr:hypothetical protein [Victivallales bacterium]